MSVRTRFAPSPTGHVHIGNIRTAIFSWLFARHMSGRFLLRIEDTDVERSTPEAIRTLLEVMAWLGLDYDEEPLYQTAQRTAHLAAAERLLAAGHAYRDAKGGAGQAILFRIPWECDTVPGVRRVGDIELPVHAETPVTVDATGLNYALISQKGKPVPTAACLAGFRGLEVFDATGACRLRLEDEIDLILARGRTVRIEGATRFRFVRREISYRDLVKGELAKPLDSMRDPVIVRSDGLPVFHLANVCDDITQQVTHIVRGDDHVENTYRHVFLFHALGASLPCYAHLPMIINAQGKPYSKRDGDAFVGDFQAKGYLPHALLNYLALLGWSPGDDREKMTRAELVQAFALERAQHAPAQMDLNKLTNLNGQYMMELPPDEFVAGCRAAASRLPWAETADATYFRRVAELMRSRTKLFSQVAQWEPFFVPEPTYDEGAAARLLGRSEVRAALLRLCEQLRVLSFSLGEIERAIHECEAAAGIPQGKLNQPLRLAVTGSTIGAGIYETMELLGRDLVLRRLQHAIGRFCPGVPPATPSR